MRGESQRFLIGAMYAPFCRTLPPPVEEWDQDLRLMKDLGFTCFHGFAEWHKIERQKGIRDFSEVDRIVDLADKHGLTLLVNVCTHNGFGFYPPRWLMSEYKGQGIVTSRGIEEIPRGLYVIPCIDDPWYQEYAEIFLRELASRYKDARSIGGWIIWGEPTLSRTGALTCYCEYTIGKFRRWLRDKYQDIDNLNSEWGSEGPADFRSWEEIWPPTGARRHEGGYAAFHDWRAFMDDNLALTIGWVNRIFKEEGASQPTIVEIMGFTNNTTASAIDPWKLGSTADIVGVSNFMEPGLSSSFVSSRAGSIAKALGKDFWVIEALGGPKVITEKVHTPTDEELLLEAAQMIGHGARCFMYWCFRPRMSDVEGGEFGLLSPSGKPLSRAIRTGNFSQKLQKYSTLLNQAFKRSSVAIFDSQDIRHLSYADNLLGKYTNYDTSLAGAYRIFTECHISVDFIAPDRIFSGALSNYKLLVLPFCYAIDEDVADAIWDFVESGGTVIADFLLGMKMTNGFCYSVAPGACLSNLFGVVRDDFQYLHHPIDIFNAAASGIFSDRLLLTLPEGTFRDCIELRDQSYPLASFDDGLTAITGNRIGLGEAIYFSFPVFAAYQFNPSETLRRSILKLVSSAKVTQMAWLPDASPQDDVALEITSLECEDEEYIFTIMNHSCHRIQTPLAIPVKASRIRDIIAEVETDFKQTCDATIIGLDLPPKGFLILNICAKTS